MNDITHHDVSSQMLTQFDREYFSRFSKLYSRVGITACSVESQLVFDSVLPLLFIFHFHFSIFFETPHIEYVLYLSVRVTSYLEAF